MPYGNLMGIFRTIISKLKRRKSSKPWSPPFWLEPAFIYIAFFVAVVATAVLLLWIVITFVVPFNIYSKETELIRLNNGQTLQVEYPNLVLAGDTPTYITLIIYGESNATSPADFTVVIPSGLTVVEPVDQSQGKTVTFTATDLGSATKPRQMKIGVVNSRSVNGPLLYTYIKQFMIIKSSLMPDTHSKEIGIETISWASARGIVNNTINEKSTLILLVTGFLSGAGTLVLQNMKTHRDRAREDRQKIEERFYKFLQEDFEGALDVFLRNKDDSRSGDLEVYNIYRDLVEQSNWYHLLSINVLKNLNAKQMVLAWQNAQKLKELCIIFKIEGQATILAESLCELCELAVVFNRKQNRLLLLKQVKSLLNAYIHWQEELSSCMTDLLQHYSSSRENLDLFVSVFKDDELGKALLEKANLQYVTDRWQREDLSALNKEVLDIVYSLHWRPLWASGERKLSEKVQRWLSRHWYE